MKANIKSILVISALLLSTLTSFSNEYQKQFSKTYPIDPFAELLIETSFSNVEMSNWDKNEVEISITVKVNADSEDKANQIFDRIKLDLIGSKSKVEVRTDIDNMNSKSGNYTININIKTPMNVKLNATNSFGDIKAAKIQGNATVKCDYGKFSADFLGSNDNDINANFGNIVIKEVAGGRLNCDFGNMELSVLSGNAQISSGYGELKLDLIKSSVTDLKITTEFGNAILNLASDCNLTIEAAVSMGSLDTQGKIEVISDTEQYGSGSFRGKIGQGSGKLTCNASFGNVSISAR